MRVLVLHNRYRGDQPSGENAVVDTEIESLRAAGVDVARYTPSSDEIDAFPIQRKVSLLTAGSTYRPGVKAVTDLVESFRPDVVHAHNVVPLVSPAALRMVAARGVPVVQTVHNYRISCAAGTHMREGSACTLCTSSSQLPSIPRRCYRGSTTQSAVMALARRADRGRANPIGTYVAISRFVKRHLLDQGVPPARVTVKYNGVATAPACSRADDHTFVFAGRLEPEKGVQVLLDAWDQRLVSGHRLVIAGSGRLADHVARAARRDPTIEYAGLLPRQALRDLIARCTAVVVPSLWDEPFGLGVIEAFAAGKQAVVSTKGALPELAALGPGIVSRPHPDELARALATAAVADRQNARVRAKAAVDQHFSLSVTTAQLLSVYEQAMQERRA